MPTLIRWLQYTFYLENKINAWMYKGKADGEGDLGKFMFIKRRQHHKHSDPGRGENPIWGANGQGWSSENLNGTPQKDQSEDDLYLTPKRYQLHLKWNRLDYQTLFGIKLEDQTWQSGRNQANKTGPFFELLSLWLHPERYFDVAKNSVFCHEHSS